MLVSGTRGRSATSDEGSEGTRTSDSPTASEGTAKMCLQIIRLTYSISVELLAFAHSPARRF